MKIIGATMQKQLSLNDVLLSKFSSELIQQIKANNKKVNAFSFTYKSSRNKVSGFLILPRKIKKKEKLPCIIYNRGGYKDFGIVKNGYIFSQLAEIAKAGYVVIGYREVRNGEDKWIDGYGSDKDIKVVLDLYPIIKNNKFIDVARIGMLGASRGAVTTYRSISKVKWVKAIVVRAGAADLVRGDKLRPDISKVFKEAFGGSLVEKKKRSVLYWANKLPKRTPILLMHGTADWRVTPLDSIELAKKLLENNIPYRLVMFEGADHFLSEFKARETALIIEWFNLYLKPKEPILPNLKPHGA